MIQLMIVAKAVRLCRAGHSVERDGSVDPALWQCHMHTERAGPSHSKLRLSEHTYTDTLSSVSPWCF